MNLQNNKHEIEIHEFSTGIHIQKRDNGWVSLGFTGQYMNATTPIPTVVERSIANEEFALTEGSSSEKPAIIGRVVGSGNDAWSVMAVVTRGQDEVGRSAAFYRYFLCQGKDNLRFILAWWEQNQKPRFNPLDFKGSPHLFRGETPQRDLAKEDESLAFAQQQPIILPVEKQRDLYTLNILAIKKFNSCKNGLPVSWAFNVEALVKPERFQVIQPTSQKAYDGLKRAIANAAQVMSTINVDEAALKSAIRSLMNSSNVKREAVGVIVEGLENEQVTPEYWENLFNAQGADKAVKQKIYSPQMVRLMTLRAIVIPETLPQFLAWLNIQPGKKPDENQIVSLEFQKAIRKEFPKEQLSAGIRYLLPNLLNKTISVDSLCWLLEANGSGSIWADAQKQFIDDIKYDLQLICNYFAGQSKEGLNKNAFKCQKEVWASLIKNWGGIQQGYYKGEEYQPLAELFENFKEYDLAAYFYQIKDREVKKDLFYQLAYLQNRRLPVVFGVEIEPQMTLIDIVVNDFYCMIEEDNVKIYQASILAILMLFIGLFIGQTFDLGGKKASSPPNKPTPSPTVSPSNNPQPLPEVIETAINDTNWKNTEQAINQIIKDMKEDEKIFRQIMRKLDNNINITYTGFKNNNPKITKEQKKKIAEAIYRFQQENSQNNGIETTGYLDKENEKSGFNQLKEKIENN
jgi:hypothetical protein